MKKIHIFLSPLNNRQKKHFLLNFSEGDTVVYLDNVVDISFVNSANLTSFSSVSIDCSKETKLFFESVIELESVRGGERFFAYSDIFYENLVLPAIKLIKFVEKEIGIGSSFYIYGAKISGKGLPVAGYKNKELNVGSKYLLGGFLFNVLYQSYRGDCSVIFYGRSGDLLCSYLFRRAALTFVDILSGLLLLTKISVLKFFFRNFRENDNKASLLYILRTPHQIRYAIEFSEIANEKFNKDSKFLLLPQARQGGIKAIVEQFSQSNSTPYLPRLNTLFNCFFKFATRNLINKRTSELKGDLIIQTGKKNFSISLNETIRELNCLFCDDIYSTVLNDVLEKRSDLIEKVVSFSMKGRYTTYEYYSCKKSNLHYDIVQTASLSNTTSAVFPLSNRFFVDSLSTFNSLKMGLKRNGGVVYSGCPYPIEKSRKLLESRDITFFTQPYDLLSTKLFLDKFSIWCSDNNFNLFVKLHPRDDKKNYFDLEGITIFSDDIPLKNVIERSMVSITRTSSVIIESLALGKPVIPLMLSNYDMAVDVGYLNLIRSAKLYCRDEKEVGNLISDNSNLLDMMTNLQLKLFDSKDIHSLVSEVYES
ncbi:hypothetical protein ISX50_08150 [Vibrio cyclitrophicus]|nr:hypothetical protein [Vibrio cyclitrophicus]UPR33121.1 hypothetical protein ISX50_08150 [Vibrio cyclitrophicus]